MIEILGAIILSILAVMLAAFGIGVVSEKSKKAESASSDAANPAIEYAEGTDYRNNEKEKEPEYASPVYKPYENTGTDTQMNTEKYVRWLHGYYNRDDEAKHEISLPVKLNDFRTPSETAFNEHIHLPSSPEYVKRYTSQIFSNEFELQLASDAKREDILPLIEAPKHIKNPPHINDNGDKVFKEELYLLFGRVENNKYLITKITPICEYVYQNSYGVTPNLEHFKSLIRENTGEGIEHLGSMHIHPPNRFRSYDPGASSVDALSYFLEAERKDPNGPVYDIQNRLTKHGIGLVYEYVDENNLALFVFDEETGKMGGLTQNELEKHLFRAYSDRRH